MSIHGEIKVYPYNHLIGMGCKKCIDDVKRTVDTAIVKAKLITKQRPRLLSDNGSCYIATELKSYLKDHHQMEQVHGRPNHPQTQGKIERYHRTMKNVVKLDNYYSCTTILQICTWHS